MNFAMALKRHELAENICGDLIDAPGIAKALVAEKLAYCILRQSELGDNEVSSDAHVIGAVAKEIKIEVFESAAAFESGKKMYTQYKIEVLLCNATWVVLTRWSRLELLEKTIIKALHGKPRYLSMLPKLKKGKAKVGSGMKNLKSWVRPTDEQLVEMRRIAAGRYIGELCAMPEIMQLAVFLQFLLPVNVQDVSGTMRAARAMTIGKIVLAEELPPAATWDPAWLGDGRPVWDDHEAIAESPLDMSMVSVNQLIVKLTSSKGHEAADMEFLKIFFATYRTFLTPRRLLGLLWQRALVPSLSSSTSKVISPLFPAAPEPEQSGAVITSGELLHQLQMRFVEFKKIVGLRVFLVLKQWISDCASRIHL